MQLRSEVEKKLLEGVKLRRRNEVEKKLMLVRNLPPCFTVYVDSKQNGWKDGKDVTLEYVFVLVLFCYYWQGDLEHFYVLLGLCFFHPNKRIRFYWSSQRKGICVYCFLTLNLCPC